MRALAGIFDETSTGYIEPISRSEMNKRLTSGRSTGIAVICCSEMSSVESAFPADPTLPVFTWQNLGGCVDECGGLEEMIAGKKISDVIVFGHYRCQFIEIGLRSDSETNRHPEKIYQEIIRRTCCTKEAMKDRYGDKFDKHIFQRAIEDYVLRELASLLKLPVIYNAANDGKLRAHAWISHDDTMENATYDPHTQTFWVLPDDEKH